MAAYAAVISLKHTINDILFSSHISLVPSTQKILDSAYNQTTSLQQVLERLDIVDSSRRRVDDLEGKIRDCANKLEDVLESYELNSQEEKYYEDERVGEAITSFAETVKKLEKEYIEELCRDDDDDDAAIVSPHIDFGVEMVGHSSQFNSIREDLLAKVRPHDLWFFSLYGEEGSGRTFIARTMFEAHYHGRKQLFDCCAWVSLCWKHQLKKILISILDQVVNIGASDYELLILGEVETLCNYLYKILEHRRYMIVLDDVRDVEVVDYLRKSLPDQCNGSIVYFTTSFKEVALLAHKCYQCVVPAFYFEEIIWFCVRKRIFNNDAIYLEFEEAAKKIIENCRCLQMLAAKTLLFLNNTEKSVELWNKIAADRDHPIFMVADELSEIRKINTDLQYCEWDMVDQGREPFPTFIANFLDPSPSLEKINKLTHPKRFFSKMQVISLLGMAGIGKTTFARKIFKDESILNHFDHLVWITFGPKYEAEEILTDILAQIYPGIDKLHLKRDEKLVTELCGRLSCMRCLIVLDDLWSNDALYYLKNLFPEMKGAILVTTTLVEVAKLGTDDAVFQMPLLDKEESWCLLRQKVFGGELCPFELEKAGRMIAEQCDGLPLLILTVADQLLKVDVSEEYWKNVASGKQKSVFVNAHNQISEALLPRYQSLPQYLKPCFLYVGVFCQRCEIPTSELTHLCIAEGFLEPSSPQMLQDFVAKCLSELVGRSLLMVQWKFSDPQMKTCRLHSVFWHLANSQAMKSKFYHGMTTYDDCSTESIESQRRLCIRNSILLGFKDVQDSMASNTSARSLLCVGPFQQYPVALNFDFKLLRVMNAVTIRLYEFLVEVERMVHLRFLSLTCNGKLPTSISKLWKLQCLIVKRYMNIKSFGNPLLLPVEIWDMKELKHLEVVGGCLPDHKCGAGLLKLSTLLGVSAQSCRVKVLKWMPNLKRLAIRIELAPDDEGETFSCLNNISRLRKLESLKCVVLNPQDRSKGFALPAPVSMFPPSLKKLSLSGMRYPWEYMSVIGELVNLQVLKLKCYAFQGPKWKVDNVGHFRGLKFLLIEDTNLVHWNDNSLDSRLEHLCIKHCYKLREIPIGMTGPLLRKIDIVDCSPLAVTWAAKLAQALINCQVKVHRSWIADK